MRKLISYSWMPVLTALAVFAVYGPLGFGRDWGLFITTMVLMPVLVLIAIFLGVATLWQILDRRKPRALSGLASVIVALVGIPTLMAYGEPLRDPVRFLVWSYTQGREVAAFPSQGGVIQYWDGWGFVGMENDSYLVFDPTDAISDLQTANQWARERNLSCEIVATRRMQARFYILTTFNCVF